MKAWMGLATLLLSASASLLAREPARGLSASDETKVRAVAESYRTGWLANDADAVLRLFTKDAVLLPHHGVEPVIGEQAIRHFWFPADSPPTTVTEFDNTIDEIGGSGELAYVRGHTHVSWLSGKAQAGKTFSNAGTYLTLLRRQPDGSWRITHQMWDDPPNQPR